MENSQAKKLIKSVFESAFDLKSYKTFITEVLCTIEANTGFNYRTIPEKFRNHIASYMRIAKYKTEDKTIDLLVVKLKENCSLDRNRSGLRNFIMNYLSEKNREATLVAFIEADTKRWRLSLICLDKETKLTDKGNLTIAEKATSAKRYSYILGEQEPSHTAQQQFLPFLENNQIPPTLSQLEKIFAVEKLSDEFFENYVDLLNNTKDEILKSAQTSGYYQIETINILDDKTPLSKNYLCAENKKIDVGNFAKKLLGQIVFLYFLQKKGWLGVKKDASWGTGDKKFMRYVFNQKLPADNYFNQFLEPLFYEALASEREQDYFTLLDRKIPFLNGGLFEPYTGYDRVKHKLELPNSLFSNNEIIKATKDSIEVTGTGILDVLDRYNFTVCEDEPLEKEVAIDPEMLGKIFENTIEDNERKGKGAFYTPRQIVHYMVKQSLIEYLASHLDYINDIKKADLFAVSSSDLLINNPERQVTHADLEKLINLAEFYLEHETRVVNKGETKAYKRELPEAIALNAARIDNLLASIKILDPAVGSGAFPVGLLIELVKIRQLLQIYTNSQLSVYELKYHAIANSIYGVDIDSGAIDVARLRLWLSLIVDEQDKIQPLPNLDYKLSHGNSLLSIPKGTSIGNELVILKQDFLNAHGESKENSRVEINEKLANLFATSKASFGYEVSFDFRVNFAEVFAEGGGFDVVIGNPPYVQIQKFSGQQCQTDWQHQNYATFVKTGDIYALFIEKGVSLLKTAGVLVYITSNKWMRAGYGKSLRNFLATKTQPIQLIDFGGYQVFKSATVDSNILITKNQQYTDSFNACTIKDNYSPELPLNEYFKQHSQIMPKVSSESWVISSAIEQQIKNKIGAKGVPLKDWDINIYRGILTGLNEAFIIDTATKERLCAEDPKSAEIIKPILRGRDIKRYQADWAGLWLINSHNNPPINIENYPAIKNHLDKFYPQLEKRQDKGITPYNLRNCAYLAEFEKEKIVWARLMRVHKTEDISFPRFSLAKEHSFVVDSLCFITANHSMKYLLAVLNSKYAANYFYKNIAILDNGGMQMRQQYIENLLVPQISPQEQQPFIYLVDKIMEAKKIGADTSEYEVQIDKLVYELYDLTPEEIVFIESK